MRGGNGIAGIKMNKRLKDQKRKKLWLAAKKQKAEQRQLQIKQAKKQWPNIWRKLKI
jgi:TnpA family transposase